LQESRAAELAAAMADKEELTILLKVRALLATAESSEFEDESRVFHAKAMMLAERHEIEESLLAYPREDLKVAVVMAELTRLRAIVQWYTDQDETWETKTAEWSSLLNEYDGVLEVACDILCLPLKRLPYGCVRHFRPHDRAKIEKLIWDRVETGKHNEYLTADDLVAEETDEAEPVAPPES
jgi:hypothetical protein